VGHGSGREGGDSVWHELANGDEGGLEQVVGDDPMPDFLFQVAQECRRLLDKLGDDELRQIAVWKLESYTNLAVAKKLGYSLAKVERPLRLIRKLWEGESAS
jgi:hypothetical protein